MTTKDPDAMPTTTPSRPDLGERTARWLGDLDHPFYDDERNRYVWYEASAIGVQIALIGSFIAGGVAVLIGGSDVVPWVILMMTPTTFGAIAMTGYISRHAADYAPSVWDLRRSRGVFAVAAVGFLVVAMLVRGLVDGEAFVTVLAGGLLAGLVLGFVGARLQRNRADAADDED